MQRLPVSAMLRQMQVSMEQTRSIYLAAPLLVKLTAPMGAEPPKARKRIEPGFDAAKEAKQKKRLEKEAIKLEKFGRRLKPIEEKEPDRSLLKDREQRARPPPPTKSEQETFDEHFLKEDWKNYMKETFKNQYTQLSLAMRAQTEALVDLRKYNRRLYMMAIKIDEQLIPFVRKGPINSVASKSYEPPEGDYFDITNTYEKEAMEAEKQREKKKQRN